MVGRERVQPRQLGGQELGGDVMEGAMPLEVGHRGAGDGEGLQQSVVLAVELQRRDPGPAAGLGIEGRADADPAASEEQLAVAVPGKDGSYAGFAISGWPDRAAGDGQDPRGRTSPES